MKNFKTALSFLFLFFANTLMVLAQDDMLNQAADAVEEAEGPLFRIIKWVLRVVAIGGGAALAVAYLTNKNESKDHLTKYLVGVIIIGILWIFMEA